MRPGSESWRTCSWPCKASSWPRASASRAIAWCWTSCSPTTKNVACTPAASSASSTAGVPSGSGPSSKVSAAPAATRSSPGSRRQRSAVSSIWPWPGTTAREPARSALRALLAGLQQPLAQLLLLLGSGIEARQLGQLVEPAQAEELLEQRGGAVEHRAELRAPGLLDDPALEQRRHRRLRGHAADPRDLRARDRLEVGDDREALGLRLRERRRARPGEQAAGGVLGDRVGGEREAAGDLAQHHAAVAVRVVLAQPRERLHDLALGGLAGVGERVDGERL